MTGYLLIAPEVVLFVVFNALPIVFSVYLGFSRWPDMTRLPEWAGLTNFRRALSDPLVRMGFRNSLYYVVLFVPGVVGFSLFLAILANAGLKGQNALRTLFFLPEVTSVTIVAIVWYYIYAPGYGALDRFLSTFGHPGRMWLNDPKTFMPAISVMSIWKNSGQRMLLFIAGLQAIPSTFHEAAIIDGASAWQRFRYVTVPLLLPVLSFVVIITSIQAFQVFAEVQLMTPSAIPDHAQVIMFWVYREAFRYFRFGYAAAVSLYLFALIFIFTALQRLYFGRRVEVY